VAAALPLAYDGGTDLSLLENVEAHVMRGREAEGGTGKLDYCVLCTDGIDNLHRRPAMDRILHPVYVALAGGGVHGSDPALLQG
jgi:hypothetical protein